MESVNVFFIVELKEWNLWIDWLILIDFFMLNATFNNISAISWRPVLVVEEVGVPGENHRPWTSVDVFFMFVYMN